MHGPARTSAVDPSVLSPREMQTLIALAQGYTNRVIAEHLGISVKTVDTHRGHALKKLELFNNAELTRYAIGRLLVDVDGRELTDADRAAMVVTMPSALDAEALTGAA